MKNYREDTGRSKRKGCKKLLGVTIAENILLYILLFRCNLNWELLFTNVYQTLEYTSGGPFKWFSEKVFKERGRLIQEGRFIKETVRKKTYLTQK